MLYQFSEIHISNAGEPRQMRLFERFVKLC